jgi:hypothetical protein
MSDSLLRPEDRQQPTTATEALAALAGRPARNANALRAIRKLLGSSRPAQHDDEPLSFVVIP